MIVLAEDRSRASRLPLHDETGTPEGGHLDSIFTPPSDEKEQWPVVLSGAPRAR
jgi:hypothetical protein